jgi:hypothetical protein
MKKRGQVWVETVIYTLIGFMLIALVFAYARPKIKEMQNEIIIKNSINSLEQIDLKIKSITQTGVGNKRIEEVKINDGKFIIDSENNLILFEIEVDEPYSQVGLNIKKGVLDLVTIDKQMNYLVRVSLNNSDVNITLDNREQIQSYSKSNVPYKFSISYNQNINSIPQINLEVQ